jgi:hypothetical protein
MLVFVGFGCGLAGGAGFLGAVAVDGPSCDFWRSACFAASILNLRLRNFSQAPFKGLLQSFLLWLECLSEPRVHHLDKLPSLNALHVILNIITLLAFGRCYGRVGSTSRDNIRSSIDAGGGIQTKRRCCRQLYETIRSALTPLLSNTYDYASFQF